jgi:hypothetical protein
MAVDAMLSAAKSGFATVKVGESYQTVALKNLEQWLTDAGCVRTPN